MPTIRIPLAAAITIFAATAISQQTEKPLADSVRAFVDQEELAGAVMLVADKEKILVTETVGWANIEEKKKIQPDSMFWIASQSKPMTCTAFMMLVDEGKVSLDDPVEKFLPEFKDQKVIAGKTGAQITLKKPSRPITVRDIMSHCSGLPFKSDLEKPTLDLFPLSARVRSYAKTPLENEPGTNYKYSNAGINTAARIIEVISEMPYEKFMDERLFEPLGMSDTTFWPTEEQAARIASAYKPATADKGLKSLEINQLHYPLTDRTVRFPMPAGGLFSTADNVARFYQLIANEGEINGKRLLSKDAIKQLTSKQTPDAIKSKYGFGFSVTSGNVGHGGAFSTLTTFEKQPGLILVWLVQHSGFPGKGAEAQDTFRNAALQKYSKK